MTGRAIAVAWLVLLAAPAAAQLQPVQQWANVASYATAFANPTIAAVEAWRSPQRGCKFGQLAISAAVVNGVALTMKHFIVSPRPCLGCVPDGDPSGHSANSMIGFSAHNWGLGLSLSFATGGLRYEAHEHYKGQIARGLLLGLAGEGAGQLLRCRPPP